MPDTFFRNEKEGKFHNIIQPNLYVRVFPNGDVLYSIRVRTSLFCLTMVTYMADLSPSVCLIIIQVSCPYASLLIQSDSLLAVIVRQISHGGCV